MKLKWFKPWGWIYPLVSWQEGFVVLLALVFYVQVFIAADRQSHLVSDMLYRIFPYVAPCLILLNWFASKSSDES